MKQDFFAKASSLNATEVTGIAIVIDSEIPSDMTIKRTQDFFDSEAKKLAKILCGSLPQGTVDRLIIKLMEHKLSVYYGRIKY